MDEVARTEETVNIAERKRQKKELKKTVGHMAWGLVIYTIIGFVIASIGVIVNLCVSAPDWLNMTDEELDELMINLESQEFYGLLSCAIILVGIGFLFLYFRKRIDKKQMFSVHKKMTPKAFIQLLCVFLGVQLLVEPGFLLMEKIFNFFGYSVMSSMEDATMGSVTLSMIICAVIVAPVVEEFVYRGFVLFSTKRFGKGYAIMISALLFGVMHENIPQSVFACMVGVVLGYVAIEYSIWWSVLLHIINNGLSELFYITTKNLSVVVQDRIFYILFGGFFLFGMFFVWKKRVYIREYWIQNKPNMKTLLYTFTTVGILVFIIMEMVAAFSMVEKLG